VRPVLDRLIDEFHERALPELVRREVAAPRVAGKAVTVIGMRRAGKTWFCFQQMQDLLARGIPKERLLYLNFEDERLLPFTAADFQEVLDTYYGKFPAFRNERCHLFLDEAQRIEGWEMFVRRVLDTEPLDVWVTGSSSRLLSSEIATSLRGRALSAEIFPFSFREFLRCHEIDVGTTERYGATTRATLQHMAARYLETGGFPEVQRLDAPTRRQVLRDYVDIVLLRDVIERHAVSNTVALRALVRHLMATPATRFSVNKFHHSLRSQGIACAKNDLYAFLDHLADAFVVFLAPVHSRSQKARQVNPRKAYAIDGGLLQAVSLAMTEDRGALLENLVYLHLRRVGLQPEYYLTRDGGEVDFVLRASARERPRLVQAAWSLRDPEVRRREEAALQQAARELRAASATIVTWTDEGPSRGGIRVVPAWRWLLQPPAR
jgi:predicted AAA+ superfamily ATPase